MFGRQRYPNNLVTTTTTIAVPDPLSVIQAGIGNATNTFSPMSAGGGAGGFTAGLRGEGVHAFKGALGHPVQSFQGAALPVRYPRQTSLDPAVSSLPNTGNGVDSSLALMSIGQLGAGM
jgi:hypothetical protein